MMSERTEGRYILVPIDLHGISRDTLEKLVSIARLLDRGLLGLLLEDIRLQQVADLPFTTEITLAGGRERSLLRDHLSLRQSLVSTDTRQLLHDLADRNQVELTFENASGSRLHTALEWDDQLDIFFPARQRWQLAATGKSATRRPIQRLGIVLTQSEQSHKVLESTLLLQRAGLVSDIYVMAVSPLEARQLETLYRPGSRISIQGKLSSDAATITRLIRQSSYDLLLLPGDCLRGIAPEVLEAALERSCGQVFVIN